MKNSIVALLLAVLCGCSKAPVDQISGNQQIAVVPDIQWYSGNEENLPVLKQQIQWIANNIERENIAFITQLGDVVQHQDDIRQWEFSDSAFEVLDGSTPYSVVYGNHDIDRNENSSENARQYFGASRYGSMDWFAGASEDGASFYQKITINGAKLLHIGLKFAPDDKTLAWAKEIIRQNKLPTIVSTHAYLTDAGYNRRGVVLDGPQREPIGENIWTKLIRSQDEVFMVIGGHNHFGDNIKVSGEYGEDGEYHQISINDAGREVIELLANYQDYPNGGDGWLQLIRFNADKNNIEVRTYSPYLDKFQTDAQSEFTMPLNYQQRWSFK